jgi:hypothetical protein
MNLNVISEPPITERFHSHMSPAGAVRIPTSRIGVGLGLDLPPRTKVLGGILRIPKLFGSRCDAFLDWNSRELSASVHDLSSGLLVGSVSC